MRTKPYTEIGIERMRCFRCGNKAAYQFQICADGNIYRPLCVECDVKLNDLVLKFIGDVDRDAKMRVYREAKG